MFGLCYVYIRLQILVFIFLIISELLYVKIARYYKIFDVSNSRGLHSENTVRGGGIIFWIGMLLYFINTDFNYPYFFVGLTLISFISFWDDLFQLTVSSRLSIHFITTSLLLLELSYFSNPALLIITVMILVVGIINISNFMDGINGMMVGNGIVVIGSLWFLNNYHLKFVDNHYIICALLGLVVFAFFNFRTKAICFAGDVGSISIGFIISFLLIKLILRDNNLIYILFLAVYGVESVLTIVHRIFLKENIFEPHRLHLFQIIVLKLGINHLIVSTIYTMIQLIVCVIVVLNLKQNIEVQLTIGIFIVLVLTIFYVTIKLKLLKMQNIDLLD